MRTAINFRQARIAAKAFQGKPLTNRQTGMTAIVSRNNLDKMLSISAVSKSETPAIHAAAVANVDALFERAIPGWSKPDRSRDPNLAAIHRFFAPMQVDGRMKMVKLTVKETVEKDGDNPLYTVEAVGFDGDDKSRAWIEASAREDGVDLGKENPQRGEWVVQGHLAEDASPKT